MASKQIQIEIGRLEQEEKQQIARLDALLPSIQSEISSVAERWIREHAASQVKGNPSVIVQLGSERVSNLKRRLEELYSAVPPIVQKTVRIGDLPHYSGPTERHEEDHFAKLFRKVINHLGPILAEFQLITFQDTAWSKNHRTGIFEYSISTGYRTTGAAGISQYLTTHKELISTQDRLKKENVALTKATADELWDAV
jgi:hypothetical protein